uniref:uncharacterized protein n=1 Tax=Semicossyphus pulcher TaxID=241346 RepID=UPI0037E99E4B
MIENALCCGDNPAEGTMCCSKFHATPGQHCCGTEIYRPHSEICCNGHRHHRVENLHCCGVQAYNIRNRRMKCCAGTLYNLTSDESAQKARCCGSILQKPLDVCCISEDKQVLYSPKTGFECCGRHYYNTSLWSCCAGKLSPVHKPGQNSSGLIKESRLESLINLNENDLCDEMHIGTVESVSLHSIVFSSVVKIYGKHGRVQHLPSTHILRMTYRYNFPQLIAGKAYFFNNISVFTDFNHDSFPKSLHFVISKCNRP